MDSAQFHWLRLAGRPPPRPLSYQTSRLAGVHYLGLLATPLIEPSDRRNTFCEQKKLLFQNHTHILKFMYSIRALLACLIYTARHFHSALLAWSFRLADGWAARPSVLVLNLAFESSLRVSRRALFLRSQTDHGPLCIEEAQETLGLLIRMDCFWPASTSAIHTLCISRKDSFLITRSHTPDYFWRTSNV